MDINEIQSIIPHRYPFLLIDRILEIDPFKRERLRICRSKSQNLKFIERGTSLFVQALLGLGGFLDRMFVFPAVGRPAFSAFE